MADAFSAIAVEGEEEQVTEDKKAGDNAQIQTKSTEQSKTIVNAELKTQAEIEAEAKVEAKIKASVKVQLNKFEQEYIDKDDEDDESGDTKKKSTDVLMVDFSSLNEVEVLAKRQSLVQKNLDSAKATQVKQIQSIADMKKLIKTQKGSAKKQLTVVLNEKLGCG